VVLDQYSQQNLVVVEQVVAAQLAVRAADREDQAEVPEMLEKIRVDLVPGAVAAGVLEVVILEAEMLGVPELAVPVAKLLT
jgi:hypothetical protein